MFDKQKNLSSKIERNVLKTARRIDLEIFVMEAVQHTEEAV